jgi:predicted nuclease of predicted toxin-antitoxin system
MRGRPRRGRASHLPAPAGSVKLWIDEDLSPSLVEVCHAGYHATSVRDRDKLSTKDHALAQILLNEGWILVTNNAGDFLKLAERAEVHPGLVFIELGSAEMEREQFMVNRVVDVDDKGACSD